MADFTIEGNRLKRQLLEKRFGRMNDMQKRAVFKAKGPLLILAGAGSGKTTVLVNRIAYIMDFGNAYYEETDFSEESYNRIKTCSEDCKGYQLAEIISAKRVKPWNILAITFTNKAAKELKERLYNMLGEDGENVNAGTFHSICLRILRMEIEKLGYDKKFTIYDSDDSQRLMRDCIKELVLDDKMYPPKSVLGEIGRAKDSMMTPSEYQTQNASDFRKAVIGKLYALYQQRLKLGNAVDFDDIICLTVKLLKEYPDLCEKYSDKFQYILVDEYQDTNKAQYQLVHLLSKKHKNICVVGDDDQSIYKFRGATIENILNFENDYANAEVIRLEQNYRSTQTILDAANEIIKNNLARKGKNLWTSQDGGDKITVYRARDDMAESQFVANAINENVQQGGNFSDNAVLYRTNAQSAGIERALVRMAIPYRIVGGTKFYDRKEIKDVMAYLHLIDNHSDDLRLKRIINEPKRGIGDMTVQNVEAIAHGMGISMYEVLKTSDEYPEISKKSAALKAFAALIDELSEMSFSFSLADLLDELLEKTNYAPYLKAQGFEGEGRLENIEELKSTVIKYEQENDDGDLGGFLEEIALYTDLDSVNDSDDKVTLMTMHSAKGLEYNNVYIIGAEENLFPSYLSLNSTADLEEERRLAYVAVTRAKQKLYITNAAERMLYGRISRNMPSRFLKEIPQELTEVTDEAANRQYQKPAERPKPIAKPETGISVGVSKKETAVIDYVVGDRIHHGTFGDGVVKSMSPMSNDILVEVAFDNGTTKKIMANFAKLAKL